MIWHFKLVNDFLVYGGSIFFGTRGCESCVCIWCLWYISPASFNIKSTMNHIPPANLGSTLPLGTLWCRGPWVVELRGEVWHFFFLGLLGGRYSRTSSVWGYLCQSCLTLESPNCLSYLCIILGGSLKSSEIWNLLLHPGNFAWIAWPGPCTVKMRIQRVTWCGPWPTWAHLIVGNRQGELQLPSLWNRLNRQRGRAEDSLTFDEVWHQQSWTWPLQKGSKPYTISIHSLSIYLIFRLPWANRTWTAIPM